VEEYTTVVTLGSGQNNDSEHINVSGARAVVWQVTASDNVQLTTGVPQIKDHNGKQLTLATAAIPGGTDSVLHPINVAGVITALDLNAAGNSRTVVLRGTAAAAPFANDGPLPGIKEAWLTLTRTATGGTTAYTVKTLVYR
jgi:hypothetical protein